MDPSSLCARNAKFLQDSRFHRLDRTGAVSARPITLFMAMLRFSLDGHSLWDADKMPTSGGAGDVRQITSCEYKPKDLNCLRRRLSFPQSFGPVTTRNKMD